MARLTRGQSQAQTRERILAVASDVVAQYGYEGASVERIAESAGYSKGAFYSNFASKDELLRELLRDYAGGVVDDFARALEGVEGPDEVIDAVARWSDERAAERKWGIIAIDFLRRAQRDGTFTEAHRDTFISQWRQVGAMLGARIFEGREHPMADEELGGIVMDMTFGGISVYLESRISTGGMLRHILQSFVATSRAVDPA
ncbi:TetR/AcrR family transcriptional regulator [Kocuria sp. M1N1S27]|uniref:TetR/AcrR family transcriptional regulator n=1 Tax=Kocuria kalidii TaxID=3376283 RepID=UPI0037903292